MKISVKGKDRTKKVLVTLQTRIGSKTLKGGAGFTVYDTTVGEVLKIITEAIKKA